MVRFSCVTGWLVPCLGQAVRVDLSGFGFGFGFGFGYQLS